MTGPVVVHCVVWLAIKPVMSLLAVCSVSSTVTGVGLHLGQPVEKTSENHAFLLPAN